MTEFFPDVDDLLDHYPPDDPVVIESIVRAYYAPVYRLALSILDSSAEAEDAVQETFIKTALNLDRYRPGTNFKAWLSAIAVNTCRGMLRKRTTRERAVLRAALQSLISNLPFSPSNHSFPEENLVKAETSDALRAALASLTEKHRIPVLLRFVHGLPIAEIAQILGVREGTVHSRLHYALKKLKGRIEADDRQIPNQLIDHPPISQSINHPIPK